MPKTFMQPIRSDSFEIKASCLDETLVNYELVMVLFITYNVLPTEKYDNRRERVVWEVRTEKQKVKSYRENHE